MALKIFEETLSARKLLPGNALMINCRCGTLLAAKVPAVKPEQESLNFETDMVKYRISCYNIICPNCLAIYETGLEFSRIG